jgi:hypothetical protein
MRSRGFEPLRRWGTGALVLLLIHGLGAARSARAGCNHLVISKSDQLRGLNRLDALILGEASATIEDDSARGPANPHEPRRPTPCSGPGCSSRVPLPVSTASQGSDGSDQWVALGAVVGLPAASLPDRTLDEPACRPAGPKPSIFHPPPA